MLLFHVSYTPSQSPCFFPDSMFLLYTSICAYTLHIKSLFCSSDSQVLIVHINTHLYTPYQSMYFSSDNNVLIVHINICLCTPSQSLFFWQSCSYCTYQYMLKHSVSRVCAVHPSHVLTVYKHKRPNIWSFFHHSWLYQSNLFNLYTITSSGKLLDCIFYTTKSVFALNFCFHFWFGPQTSVLIYLSISV